MGFGEPSSSFIAAAIAAIVPPIKMAVGSADCTLTYVPPANAAVAITVSTACVLSPIPFIRASDRWLALKRIVRLYVPCWTPDFVLTVLTFVRFLRFGWST